MQIANNLVSKALVCANLVKNAIYPQSIRLKSSTQLFGSDDRRRHGYKIRLHQGFLPRNPDESKMLPMPEYRPRDVWAPKRALFGQNDYIDILGSERIHPVSLHYHVPFYARGMKGNEFKMILHKKKMLDQTTFPKQQPKKYTELKKRINYMYRWMNQKTPNPREPTNQW